MELGRDKPLQWSRVLLNDAILNTAVVNWYLRCDCKYVGWSRSQQNNNTIYLLPLAITLQRNKIFQCMWCNVKYMSMLYHLRFFLSQKYWMFRALFEIQKLGWTINALLRMPTKVVFFSSDTDSRPTHKMPLACQMTNCIPQYV